MAIYHFSAQVASRSAGRSAVAMAAYRSGERLTDERTGELKHYKRDAKPETVILAPAQSPGWVQNRGRLWNEVEKAEKRKDAQLCREINVALPKEFSPRRQIEEIKDFCQREFVDRGMVADIAVHRDDPNNPHAHIMLTTREISADGFGGKVRAWNDRELLVRWREQWAEQVNRVFERNQRSERIDHRSFEQQGVTDRLPTIHEGPTVREMEQRGQITDRGSINRSVREHNSMVIDLAAYAKEREKIAAEMARIQAAPKTMKQIDDEHSRLYWQRNNLSGDIHKLQSKLERIEKVQQLEKERDVLRKQQDELQPKNAWQRITKPNQQRIDVIERDIQRVETLIKGEQRDTPAASEVPNIEKEIFSLQGTLKAIDRAFKAIDQERRQMQQEELKQRMRNQAKYQQRDRDQEWER
ncbi:MobA/MobL family protein [Paenibacillus frigoriresistens]|uniref:MobQ family relaxase n=1 Tax=Paenibacillus alginolyticus TaxID=59839 RepID=UPI001565A65A|nr:MobQ family relaxase [Paenibacillus frigoriresistens]NRF95789.1 MobA/MobL family protein [Paenibacillus frigoriresistens]